MIQGISQHLRRIPVNPAFYVIGVFCLWSVPVNGQVFTCLQSLKLTASDAEPSDGLSAVAVDGDVAVAGANGDDCGAGADCGAAYIYRFNGSSWLQEQKLTASDAASGDFFGLSVAVSGNVAVVSAVNDNCVAGTLCGSAYVFRFDGSSWIEEQKLTASDAAANDRFGIFVSVDGNVAIVGARTADCVAGADCGAAYVYRFDGADWNQEQKLTASDAAATDEFGFSVAVNGSVAVVGSIQDDCVAGGDCGAAYVFRFDGANWDEEQKLVASDAGAVDFFGVSVDVEGDLALVGANRHDCPAGKACGSAYVFRYNGASWSQEQELTASDAAANDRFGASVSISGDLALVGAREDDCTAGSDCGSAYVYRYNGSSWDDVVKLAASDADANDRFGIAVSIDGESALIGAINDDGAANNAGAAYVFRCLELNVPPVPATSSKGLGTLAVTLAVAGLALFANRRRWGLV